MITLLRGSYLEKRFTFYADGIASDPDIVRIGVESPNTENIYTFGIDPEWSKISTGVYKFRVQCTEAGQLRKSSLNHTPVFDIFLAGWCCYSPI